MEYIPWVGSLIFTAVLAVFTAWGRYKDKLKQNSTDVKVDKNAQKIDHNTKLILDQFAILEARMQTCEETRTSQTIIIARQDQEMTDLRILVRKLESQLTAAVVTVDEAGIIIDWSPSATEMFRWSRLEAIGRNLEILIPEGYKIAHKVLFDKAVKEKNIPRSVRDVEGINRYGILVPLHIELSAYIDNLSNKTCIVANFTRR